MSIPPQDPPSVRQHDESSIAHRSDDSDDDSIVSHDSDVVLIDAPDIEINFGTNVPYFATQHTLESAAISALYVDYGMVFPRYHALLLDTPYLRGIAEEVHNALMLRYLHGDFGIPGEAYVPPIVIRRAWVTATKNMFGLFGRVVSHYARLEAEFWDALLYTCSVEEVDDVTIIDTNY